MILERENLHFVSENVEKKVSSIKQVKLEPIAQYSLH